MFSVAIQGLSRIRTEPFVRCYWMAKLLIESGYDGAPFRREVDARLFYEMFDLYVSQHEAVGALAVMQLSMFATYLA